MGTISFLDALGRILAVAPKVEGLKDGERKEVSASVKKSGRIQQWISVTDSGDVLRGSVNGFAVHEGQTIRVTVQEKRITTQAREQ